MIRRAFTILELLAASALTALLMVAVLHVVGALGLTRAALARQGDAGAWRSDLRDTLRSDLTNASAASFPQDGMVLVGHGALDRATLAHVHEPVTVIYGLATIHGRRWLVRTQWPRDGLSTEPGWAELLCPHVTAFTVRSAGGLFVATTVGASDGTTGTVPAIVFVSLDGPAGRLMNETMVVK